MRVTPWPKLPTSSMRPRQHPARATPPRTSRFWRGWSRYAGGRACISAARTSARSTIWPPRSWTMRWTRPWPAIANRIEIELAPDDVLTVRDNGRGIPIDPHPKFKNKSALEVIMTTLHAGGKFGGKVYDTSGGLHGVGSSVVNALSEWMEVEVARDRQDYADALRARQARRQAEEHRRRSTAAALPSASSRTSRSSARSRISPPPRSIAWRSRRPICSAASRSAGSAIPPSSRPAAPRPPRTR